MNNLNADAVDAEIEATKRELTDIMNVDSPLRDRVRGEMGMDGIQRAVHAVIRLQTRMHALKATATLAEPAPVEAARDAYSDQMNLDLRQSIATNVLEAMDVDQYLIDAVRNATPDNGPMLHGEDLRVASEKVDEWVREDDQAAAVEAAAQTLIARHWLTPRQVDDATRAMYLRDARAALDAALPHLSDPAPVASQEHVAEVLYTAICKTGDDCEDLAAALLAASVFRDEATVKAEAIREAAAEQRSISGRLKTRDGKWEHEGFADWLDEQAAALDPTRTEGAHP